MWYIDVCQLFMSKNLPILPLLVFFFQILSSTFQCYLMYTISLSEHLFEAISFRKYDDFAKVWSVLSWPICLDMTALHLTGFHIFHSNSMLLFTLPQPSVWILWQEYANVLRDFSPHFGHILVVGWGQLYYQNRISLSFRTELISPELNMIYICHKHPNNFPWNSDHWLVEGARMEYMYGVPDHTK